MATEIKIPNVGESITSANVARWHKQNGEAVAKGETVLTIETDKVSNDIEADVAGVLNILVQEGEEVAIGTVVATLDEGAVAEVETEEATTTANAEEDVIAEPEEAKELDIIVPAAGESITSANIGRWHAADNSQVNKGDTLVTLETDKVSNELEAEESGVLHIDTPEGEEVDIGTVIGKISVGASAAPAQVSEEPKAAPSAPKPQAVNAVASAPAPAAPAVSSRPDLSVNPSASERGGQPLSEDNGRTTRRKMSMLRRAHYASQDEHVTQESG